jgi:hypothetical protein
VIDTAKLQNPEKLNELLRKYCPGAVESILAAPDHEAAVRLKESVCAQFEKECGTGLIATATREYLKTVVKRRRPA